MAIPGAILLGSMIIGAGLYFGLRSKDAAPVLAPPPPSPPGPGGAAAPLTAPPALAPPGPVAAPMMGGPMGGLGMPAAPPELHAKVVAQATKALEKQRPTFLKTCWEPSLKASPEPSKAKYIFNVTFDGATGKELSRGISEQRDMSRPDVGQCLRALPLSLEVEPPGMNVNVDVPLILP
jgi:hypothetical protein